MSVTEVDYVILYAIKPISDLSQNEKYKWAILNLKTITFSQIGDETLKWWRNHTWYFGDMRSCDSVVLQNGPFIFSYVKWTIFDLDACVVTWPIFCHIHFVFGVKPFMTFIWPLDWRMEAKRRRFWNFFESASYWKFCARWWITNWKNCPNWKWRLWNIVGRIWKSKRNPRTKIWLVIWWIEIIKCSMVLEY